MRLKAVGETTNNCLFRLLSSLAVTKLARPINCQINNNTKSRHDDKRNARIMAMAIINTNQRSHDYTLEENERILYLNLSPYKTVIY
jgi:hypothetical protein